ncbi:hypothetical protein [Marinobacterium sp. LSUCC0821]|uniref:hypothetical protein n=1 Tax=Marinobacterium sp. LSUCC0821 TaxID=2668067 RepID=UPI0014525DAB|nr:hypothetical protein [Marinobacterium sp. LSUCC0821]QJD71229.1 hypothetical protein HH196_05735 [Marinobacterium sp. LSUCC0821]
MPWMACIPLMQEQLTVYEEWNWLQEKHFARNVPQAEGAWSVFITMDGWYTENAGRNFR